MFNDYWMRDQGFITVEAADDLRDLIARRHCEREDYTLTPEVPVMQAIKMMRLYDVSQMAVLDGETLCGILDESDVLMAITRDPDGFDKPVSDYMSRRLETVSASDSVESLLPIFRADRVAIVMDGHKYLGLITRIDLISYLRKRMST
jgi:cystathionine beta-synthase